MFTNFSTINKNANTKSKTSIKELIYLVKPEWKGFLCAAVFHGIASAVLMYLPKVIPGNNFNLY